MRDESAEPHDDPVILRNRAEAFADGYRQAVGDAQSWVLMNGDRLSAVVLLSLMVGNMERYTDFAASYDRIRKGIAEAEAGLTVDRGDFTQYLKEDGRDDD